MVDRDVQSTQKASRDLAGSIIMTATSIMTSWSSPSTCCSRFLFPSSSFFIIINTITTHLHRHNHCLEASFLPHRQFASSSLLLPHRRRPHHLGHLLWVNMTSTILSSSITFTSSPSSSTCLSQCFINNGLPVFLASTVYEMISLSPQLVFPLNSRRHYSKVKNPPG